MLVVLCGAVYIWEVNGFASLRYVHRRWQAVWTIDPSVVYREVLIIPISYAPWVAGTHVPVFCFSLAEQIAHEYTPVELHQLHQRLPSSLSGNYLLPTLCTAKVPEVPATRLRVNPGEHIRRLRKHDNIEDKIVEENALTTMAASSAFDFAPPISRVELPLMTHRVAILPWLSMYSTISSRKNDRMYSMFFACFCSVLW